jgi:hypothetical protein
LSTFVDDKQVENMGATKMTHLRNILCGVFVLVAQSTMAAWSSGGGSIQQDTINPWFITKPGTAARKISYCLEENLDNFSQKDLETIEEKVRGAIAFWKEQFKYASNLDERVQINTNLVKNESCLGTEDLIFQFGYLSPTQLVEIKKQNIDISRFVALAMRTEYDVKNLQGKGFIYVGSDLGTNPFKILNPRLNPWSDDDYDSLTSILIHELGHVFGVPHFGDRYNIMGEQYPEFLVSTDLKSYYLNPTFNRVLWPDTNKMGLEFCHWDDSSVSETLQRFFGVPNEHPCVKVISEDGSGDPVVSSKHSESDSWRELGRIEINMHEIEERLTPLVKLFLPKEQKVFDDVDYMRHLSGPGIREVQYRGIYKPKDSSIPPRPVFLQAGPNTFQLGGSMGYELIPNLMANEVQDASGWRKK